MPETLQRGSRGPLVQLLQTGLARHGSYSGAIDGVFGPRTRTAVREFQTEKGLTRDGIVGPLTWRALEPYLSRMSPFTVRSGDTVSGIAARHGITIGELLAANPAITDPEMIFLSQVLTIPWPGSVISTDIPYSSGVMHANLASLKRRFAFLESGIAGKSVLGKDIPFARFGRGPVRVLYNAAHHANEWITAPLLMLFFEDLCRAKARGESLGGFFAQELFERVSLYIVPMVNPDGVNLVTGQIRPESAAYRAAWEMRGTLPFPSAWKANIRGVDLNNNYPAYFERGKEEKEAQGRNIPGPRDYTGPSPFSEPESAAMAALTCALDPVLTVALHTQGREIYWRFLDHTPPESLRIGERMAEASGYILADPPGASYGGYKDWFILRFNRPGYTVEAGYGENPLPIEDFDSIYQEVPPILLIGATEAQGLP